MNSVYITGEMAKQPLEMIDNDNKKTYYKLAIKTKRTSSLSDEHYDFINLRAYKNQIDIAHKLDIGNKVFITAFFKSSGEYSEKNFFTELQASSITQLD